MYVPKAPPPTEEQIKKDTEDFLKSLSEPQLAVVKRIIKDICDSGSSHSISSDDLSALLLEVEEKERIKN